MYKIQANPTGTRSIEVSEEHLLTIKKYALLNSLIDSTGIINDTVLVKLKLTLRSLLESNTGKDNDLLNLCLDVIYHDNMKAYGLRQLALLYIEWINRNEEEEPKDSTVEL